MNGAGEVIGVVVHLVMGGRDTSKTGVTKGTLSRHGKDELEVDSGADKRVGKERGTEGK
jgi:hypothetical protein